jgi:hypothetical protein
MIKRERKMSKLVKVEDLIRQLGYCLGTAKSVRDDPLPISRQYAYLNTIITDLEKMLEILK